MSGSTAPEGPAPEPGSLNTSEHGLCADRGVRFDDQGGPSVHNEVDPDPGDVRQKSNSLDQFCKACCAGQPLHGVHRTG